VNPRTIAKKPDTSMMTMRMTSSQEMGMREGSSGGAHYYHDSSAMKHKWPGSAIRRA
jgi:hypothetical protein